MVLQEVLENEKDQYNQFVAASSGGSFLQSWEWGQWQSVLGREVKRLKLQVSAGGGSASGGESWKILGVVQLIKMPLPFGKYYLYSPYGPVLTANEQLREILFSLKSKFPEAVFIRIEPKDPLTLNAKFLIKSPNIQPAKTLIIELSKSQEDLLKEMHPKTRYNIRVAQKHNVEIKDEFAISVGHGLFFDEAIKVIIETSKRQEFATFPASYYKKMTDFFAVHNRGNLKLHIYKTIFQNQLLAAAIMVDFGDTRTFLFGGSSELHKNVMAAYLLHWQAIRDAQSAGFKFYDFWGIETSSGQTPGFVRFKLGFGGQERIYAGAHDIINNKLLYKTYTLGRVLNKLRKKISPREYLESFFNF